MAVDMTATRSVRRRIRSLLCAVIVIAGSALGTAQAQVNVAINVAPPLVRYEAVPRLNNGYAWAPGYWAWHGNHYVWMRGRQIVQRPGHYWVADHWASGNRYRAGYWQPQRKNHHRAQNRGGRYHVERYQGRRPEHRGYQQHRGRHGHGGGNGRGGGRK